MTSGNDNIRSKIRTISKISSLINASLEIKDVLNNSLAAVEQFIKVETSSIFEVDNTCGELYFCCARGIGAEKIRELRLKIGDGIAGYVAQTEKALIISDAYQDSRFLPTFDHITGFTTRSILCVPLKAKNRLIGVLELLNKTDGTDFDEEDIDILSILANEIGIALENARIYKKLQEKLLVTVEELKFTQSKLLQSERLAALGKLAHGVAHEVRNPVAIIGGMTSLLSKKIPTNDPSHELLREIKTAVTRLERMVKEIESFTRIPEPHILPSDVSGVIHNVLDTFSEQLASLGISLAVQMPLELPLIPVDINLIGRVLHHLIVNSLEAMPLGGNLSITLVLEPKSLKISLQDTGTGIPAENLPLIFDPFFSTKPQGTGMGLTIAHRLISAHKGEISLCSTPGAGTTVNLSLPRWLSD